MGIALLEAEFRLKARCVFISARADLAKVTSSVMSSARLTVLYECYRTLAVACVGSITRSIVPHYFWGRNSGGGFGYFLFLRRPRKSIPRPTACTIRMV